MRFSVIIVCLWLAPIAGWSVAPAHAADETSTIRLLSNEAADRCIQDEACLRDLFLKAALGGDTALPLLKATPPSHIASIAGDQVPAPLLVEIDKLMKGISLLAKAAGADLNLAQPGEGDVINMIILVSNDFARDREQSFKRLLADVFAGNTATYDDLAGGSSPVCQAHLFADRSAAVQGALALAESDIERAPFLRCLHRLALNALGLRNPLPEGTDSVLNPKSTRTGWTSIDFMLVKLLYDPLIEPGMTVDELTKVFPKVHGKLFGSSS